MISALMIQIYCSLSTAWSWSLGSRRTLHTTELYSYGWGVFANEAGRRQS